MRVFIVLLSVIGLSLGGLDIPDHLRAPLKVMRRACVGETNAKVEDIDASRNGHLVDTPEMRCYIMCLLDHSGMMEDDGRIHWTEVYHLLTPALQKTADHVQEQCGTIHGDTKCDTAYQTVRCYYDVAPEGAELP